MSATAATIVLVTLVVLSCLGLRSALCALLLSGQFDFSGPMGQTNAVGSLNLIRALVVPALVLFWCRKSGTPAPKLRGNMPIFGVGALLVILAAVNTRESDFPTASHKFVVYLCLIGLNAFVLSWSIRTGAFSRRILEVVAVIPVAIGGLQTYALPSHSFATADNRFTSFTSPQSFGLWSASVVVISLCSRRHRSAIATIFGLAGVALSGSRSSLLAILIAAAWLAVSNLRRQHSISAARAGAAILILASVAVVLVVPHVQDLSSSRVGKAAESVLSGTTQDVGTFEFRAQMNSELWRQFKSEKTARQFWGVGTDNAALTALLVNPRYQTSTVDANRVAHDEYVRTLLEQGYVGLSLLIVLLLLVVSRCIRASREMLPAFPLIFLALGVENIFAESIAAVGYGFLLVACLALSPFPQQSRPPKASCSHIAGTQFPLFAGPG